MCNKLKTLKTIIEQSMMDDYRVGYLLASMASPYNGHSKNNKLKKSNYSSQLINNDIHFRD